MSAGVDLPPVHGSEADGDVITMDASSPKNLKNMGESATLGELMSL